MKIPTIDTLGVAGKLVFVRLDLDVPFDGDKVVDDARIRAAIPTIKKLLEMKAAKIILGGHIGRFEEGKTAISTFLLAPILTELIEKEVSYCSGITECQNSNAKLFLLPNLRASSHEEDNDSEFAKQLSTIADFYVNEAFAVSHRAHASIVLLPKLLPHAAGLRFAQEVKELEQVLQNPKRPVIVTISGVKEDKLAYLEPFKKFADKILIAGRLPIYLEDYADPKVEVAKLIPDKEDITIHSMELFEQAVVNAGTIVVSGPMGKFEEIGHRQGTERVLKSIAATNAFKVAGGGDTINAIHLLNLDQSFNWLSVGGGAMLDFLANGTLPGIEALQV